MTAAADTLAAAPSREPARHSMTTRVVIYGALVLFAIVYLMPLVVMVMTSLKPLAEITGGNMFYFPHDLTFEPWKKAWGTTCVGLTCEGIKGYVWNSVKMVVPAVLISSLLGALNGYVLTKWRFPRPQARVRHDAVRLLHSIPVGAHSDGDDPRQARRHRADAHRRDRLLVGIRQPDRQPRARARGLRARASRRSFSAITTRRFRPSSSRRRRSTARASSRSSAASFCRTPRPSSSSPSSISSPTSGTTSCSARPSPRATRAR